MTSVKCAGKIKHNLNEYAGRIEHNLNVLGESSTIKMCWEYQAQFKCAGTVKHILNVLGQSSTINMCWMGSDSVPPPLKKE